MGRTLPPQEEETKEFLQKMRAEVEQLSCQPVARMSRIDAASELLRRLYLLSLDFTSTIGKLSRVACIIIKVTGDTSGNWQESMRQRHNPMYGEVDNREQVLVRRLHEDVDIEFVKELMHLAGLPIDALTNRADVTIKRQGLDQMFYYDYYLDRALSIRLADTLVKLDKVMANRITELAEKRHLADQANQQLREQRRLDRTKIWPLRVLEWFQRLIAEGVDPGVLANAEVERAETALHEVESTLRHELEIAYHDIVVGKKVLPDDSESVISRTRRFYQQFFGCSWRDFWTVDPDEETLAGSATLENRALFIARVQRLRTKLSLPETYTYDDYLTTNR